MLSKRTKTNEGDTLWGYSDNGQHCCLASSESQFDSAYLHFGQVPCSTIICAERIIALIGIMRKHRAFLSIHASDTRQPGAALQTLRQLVRLQPDALILEVYMSIEECIRGICILAVIFGTIIYLLLLWILSVLIDIRKELRGKKNDRKL